MKQELQEKVFARFSFFNPKGSIRETLIPFGLEIGDGWFKLFWDLCENIEKELKTVVLEEGQPAFKVLQVKEKYGGLRYYTNWFTDSIDDLINKAETASYKTCEVCGEKGYLRAGGWINTLCDIHAKGRAKTWIKQDNVCIYCEGTGKLNNEECSCVKEQE